jgi:hypothetical protein
MVTFYQVPAHAAPAQLSVSECRAFLSKLADKPISLFTQNDYRRQDECIAIIEEAKLEAKRAQDKAHAEKIAHDRNLIILRDGYGDNLAAFDDYLFELRGNPLVLEGGILVAHTPTGPISLSGRYKDCHNDSNPPQEKAGLPGDKVFLCHLVRETGDELRATDDWHRVHSMRAREPPPIPPR